MDSLQPDDPLGGVQNVLNSARLGDGLPRLTTIRLGPIRSAASGIAGTRRAPSARSTADWAPTRPWARSLGWGLGVSQLAAAIATASWGLNTSVDLNRSRVAAKATRSTSSPNALPLSSRLTRSTPANSPAGGKLPCSSHPADSNSRLERGFERRGPVPQARARAGLWW